MTDYKNALVNIMRQLNIPYTSSNQDWEIEFADKSRIAEFINFFNTLTDPNEKHVLMSLLLASYDDYLAEDANVNQTIWNAIVSLLDKDLNEYNDILDHWAIWNELDELELFDITPAVRAYLNSKAS